MILASFNYVHVRTNTGNTRDPVIIGLDFRSLYQINPDHLIILKYASICGVRQDAGGAQVLDSVSSRLIGSFNETRNIIPTIISPIHALGQTLVTFDGIAFNPMNPFVAPEGARILMPANFQIEFTFGSLSQIANNDDINVYFTIGYDIQFKDTRF